MLDKSSSLFVDDYEEPLCEEVQIIEKRIKIPSGEEELLVKVQSKGNGIPFVIPRDELVKNNFFNKLTLHGLSIIESKESYAELRASINESEKHAPLVYQHDTMGFREFENKKYFFAYTSISKDENSISSVNKKMQAMLKPKGSFAEWQVFIRKHIVPHTERSLTLMLGATAPLAFVLKEEGAFVDVPVYALINTSSTGKTTLLYLISSMFANPQLFIGSFNATTGALYAMLEKNGGMPYLCDEATHVPNIDWDDLLYVLPTGKEKRRLNSKGELKPLVNFSGAVIMTSETSILGRSRGTGGESCRIIEFNLNCFEGEPTLPDEVRRICFQNYGWATEPLIKLLFDEEYKQRIISKFQVFSNRLMKTAKFTVTGIERRLIARCALILTAGWLLKKAIKCNFNLKNVEKYLSRYLENAVTNLDNRDEADKIIDKISGFVCANLEKFPTVENLYPTSLNRRSSSFWGATGYYGLHPCIWIQEDILRNRILFKEMQNANLTLQSLHKKDFVIKFYDKNYFIKKDFGGIVAKYCCITPNESSSLLKIFEDTGAFTSSVETINTRVGALYDKRKFNYLNSEKEIAYVEIAHADMQSYSITMSKLLQTLMSMTSKGTLYTTPIPAQKILLLSKVAIAKNSIPCHFRKYGDRYCAKGVRITDIQASLELNVPVGYKIVASKIDIDDYKGKPIAAIVFDDSSVSIEPVENPPVDYVTHHISTERSYSKISSLLNDEED